MLEITYKNKKTNITDEQLKNLLKIDFVFTDEQKKAIKTIIEHTLSDKDDKPITLSGKAGSGKSTIVKAILVILENFFKKYKEDFILAAPTNKAVTVLGQYTDAKYQTYTIHQLLKIYPNISLANLDYKNLKFLKSLQDQFPTGGLAIIDECSMINDELHETIIDAAQSKNCKLIFMGDKCQIRPVDQEVISCVFDELTHNVIVLNTVKRQKEDSYVLSIAETIRKDNLNNTTLLFEKGNDKEFKVYKNVKDFLKTYLQILKPDLNNPFTSDTKLISYTNKKIDLYNRTIRKYLNFTEEVHIGDKLMGMSNENGVFNSLDYTVLSIERFNRNIFDRTCIYKKLLLESNLNKEKFYIDIFSNENNKNVIQEIGKNIELLRQKALNEKRKEAKSIYWQQYYAIYNNTSSFIEFTYDNRVTRPKTFNYGYACTAHKSQGSGYENVFIDLDDIYLCKKVEERNELLYVALTRTKENVFLINSLTNF